MRIYLCCRCCSVSAGSSGCISATRGVKHNALRMAAGAGPTAAADTSLTPAAECLQLVVATRRTRRPACTYAVPVSNGGNIARVFCDDNDPNSDDDTCGALLGGRRAVYPIVLYGDCYEPEAYWGPRTLDALKGRAKAFARPARRGSPTAR